MAALRAMDVAGAAARDAAAAAARGGIDIQPLEDLPAIRDAVELFRSIWGPEDGSDLIGVATLRALIHCDNYVVGAYDGDEMVGAITGFVGWHAGHLQLHSHILGVSPGAQGRSVGFALKEHQRAWALERGIAIVTWTFDPLVSRNAYFNLTKLGAAITAYYPSFYGQMNDGINGGDQTDRVLVEWALDSTPAIAASTGAAKAPDVEHLIQAGAEIAIVVGENELPITEEVSGHMILVGVPRDIVELRRGDADLATRWRATTRQVLSDALNDGYVVVTMTRSGYYVLERVK